MLPEQTGQLIGEGINIIKTVTVIDRVKRSGSTCYVVYDYGRNDLVVVCSLSPKDSRPIVEDIKLRVGLRSHASYGSGSCNALDNASGAPYLHQERRGYLSRDVIMQVLRKLK